ncbi:MAG: TVP38/TMEM64 family protein [Caldilinea sp.]
MKGQRLSRLRIDLLRSWRFGLLVGLLASAVVVAWQFWPMLWTLAQDETALRAFVSRLGMWGPVVLVSLNAIQIVVAPLPGYVMQAAAGYLYGPFWGGVWGALGVLIGSTLAMAIARYFGRPIVERLVGEGRLNQWERLTFSTSTAIWFVILLAPTGDLPYFMAGLSHVSFAKIILLTLAIRVPSTMVVAAAGAGVWLFSGWQLVLILAGLGIGLMVFMRYQDRLQLLIDRRVQAQLSKEESA